MVVRPAEALAREGRSHCAPTVDRYDAYHVVHGDRVVAIVPIDAAREPLTPAV